MTDKEIVEEIKKKKKWYGRESLDVEECDEEMSNSIGQEMKVRAELEQVVMKKA